MRGSKDSDADVWLQMEGDPQEQQDQDLGDHEVGGWLQGDPSSHKMWMEMEPGKTPVLWEMEDGG